MEGNEATVRLPSIAAWVSSSTIVPLESADRVKVHMRACNVEKSR